MMHKLWPTTVLFFLFSSFLLLKSQDYKPFLANEIYVYDTWLDNEPQQDSFKILYTLRVDSISGDGNDSLFLFNEIVPDAMTRDNLFGKSFSKSTGGIYRFFGSYGDTFLIHTRLPIDSSWTFHADMGLSARISKRSYETFLGVQDSVLTISLSNGDSMRLSQHFGAIEIKPFLPVLGVRNWPYTKYGDLKNRMVLRGIDEMIGENMPWFEVFFDIPSGTSLIDQGGIHRNPSYTFWKILENFVSPEGDSIHLVIEKERLYHGQTQTAYGYLGHGELDTVDIYHLREEWYPKQMSFEMIIESVNESEIYGSFRLGIPLQYSARWGNRLSVGFKYFNGRDTADNSYFNFESFDRRTYIAGMGYQKRYWGYSPAVYQVETICLQTGTDTLGECFEPSVLPIDPLLPEGEMFIYPNPAKNKLKIELSGLKAGDYILSIMDLQARVYQQKDVQIFSKKELELNLEALAAGFYMVILRAGNGKILRQPLSIRK